MKTRSGQARRKGHKDKNERKKRRKRESHSRSNQDNNSSSSNFDATPAESTMAIAALGTDRSNSSPSVNGEREAIADTSQSNRE